MNTPIYNEQPINVLLVANEAVVCGLFVTAGSMLCATKEKVRLHLMNTGMQPITLEKFRDFISEFSNCELLVYDVDLSVFEGAQKWYGNYSTYAKILVGRYVNAPRIIYCDPDFLCNKDFGELYKAKMDGIVAMCTPTPTIPYLRHDCPFACADAIGEHEPYFNAGFIMIDLEKWRAGDYEHRIIDLMKSGVQLSFADQTLLNYVFRGHWKALNTDWGLMVDHGSKFPANTNFHFAGSKPWLAKCNLLAAGLWWQFYNSRVKGYVIIPHAKLIEFSIALRSMLVQWVFPFVYPLSLIMPKALKEKCQRMMGRRKWYGSYREAEEVLKKRWRK